MCYHYVKPYMFYDASYEVIIPEWLVIVDIWVYIEDFS